MLPAVPNLVLISSVSRETRFDLEEVARRVEAGAPDIRTWVHKPRKRRPRVSLTAALRPTLVVSQVHITHRHFLRGHITQGWDGDSKAQQYERLEAASVPVPRWARVTPELVLDPAEWGEYVVVKPDAGRMGADVKIKRTGRRLDRPQQPIKSSRAGGGGRLVQRFVYTGRYPVHIRVITLFGVPLLCMRYEGAHEGYRPLASRDAFGRGLEETGGINITSNRRQSLYSLVHDDELIDLARRAHAVFPEVPYMAIDLVRDVDTGEAFVLEGNPTGEVLMHSTEIGRAIQKDFDLDFYAQFDALQTMADVLIEKTRALAR